MSWTKLKTAYEKRGLVLVLGAGESTGCELPTWHNLLQRIIDDLNYQFLCHASPPHAASACRKGRPFFTVHRDRNIGTDYSTDSAASTAG